MASKNNYHVVPHANGWAVKKENSKRASAITRTKKEAETIGKHFAKKSNGELITHNKDGKISRRESYGNDPCPPKDKK